MLLPCACPISAAQLVKGKCDALQLLFATLLTESEDVFPQEAAEYK